MKFLSVKNLASSRAMLSVLSHLEQVKDLTLTLKKSEVSNTWATSKSSRRDIALAAASLSEIDILTIDIKGAPGQEVATKTRMQAIAESSADTYELSFTFTQKSLDALKEIRNTLFANYAIEDFTVFKSRFSVNSLLASEYTMTSKDKYISYELLRSAFDAEGEYAHKQAFYRHVVQVAFKDLGLLPTNPIKYEPSVERNMETNRPITYGIIINK